MKSKKAEEYIEKNIIKSPYPEGDFYYINVANAVEIAEKEMKEKAIEAHLYSCPNLYDRNCYISENGMCEYRSGGECEYMSEFIEELNK